MPSSKTTQARGNPVIKSLAGYPSASLWGGKRGSPEGEQGSFVGGREKMV
jgi:hypothetical protein